MFSSLAACLLFSTSVTSATPNPQYPTSQYNVEYPISKLGGCVSPSDCQIYCADPAHQSDCTEYSSLFTLLSSPQPTPDPALVCSQFPGCAWTGSYCQCSPPTPTPYPTSITYTPYPTPTHYYSSSPYPTPTYYYYSPSPTPYPTYSSSNSGSDSSGSYCTEPSGGCGEYKYWETSTCSCKSMEDACRQHSNCTWINNTCQCSSSVQAASTASNRFPIGELGNCTDCSSCSRFCNASTKNRTLCLAYIAKEEQKTEQSETIQPPAPPLILSRFDSPLTGNHALSLQGLPGSSIDLYLQSLDYPTEPLFLTRLPVTSSQPFTYSWNTTDSPSGHYRILAKTLFFSQSSPAVSTLEVTLAHPPPADQPAPQASDIVFPSQFNPQSVPVAKNFRITTVETFQPQPDSSAIRFSGTAQPYATITLLIYTNPIVVTVTADANGVWHYDLQKPLSAGNHTAYVAVTTSTGAKIRSEAKGFSIIAPVAAAGQSDQEESFIVASATSSAPTSRWLVYAGGAITIAFLLFLVLYTTLSPRTPPELS